ncbi:MAG: hypothetical protein JRJ68_01120 [Deltaproteobacteria bacterium]|nr:hypothetical protein [Deltaproteobacteria bacterium]
MIQNIIYTVIFVMIVVPSWQVGSIKMEKITVAHMLEEQADSVKKYNYSERVAKNTLKKNLEIKGLPTEFTFEVLEGSKVRISYQYYGDATVFGYTYYQTSETLSAETKD